MSQICSIFSTSIAYSPKGCLSSKSCPECRADIFVTKKAFLFYVNYECQPAPVSDDILIKTNTNLLDQLTENAEEIENLVTTCTTLELQTYSMQKDCDDKKAKIRSMEKIVAARNKAITSKEQEIRHLQAQVKDLKTENSTLKKNNHEISLQLKDQKTVEAKMKNIMADNQRLKHLLEIQPAQNVNSSGDKSRKKKTK